MSPIKQANDTGFTVGVALDGAGWHPAAWREPGAQADALFRASTWQARVATAEDGGLDYVSIEDALHLPSAAPHDTADAAAAAPPPRPEPSAVDGRLDAVLLASWLAARSSRIGIIPVATTTHTEPFHVATGLQTLDHISGGRAGAQLRVSPGAADAAAFGRRATPEPEALLDEAAEIADVARKLWDSWEDGAEIRDTATGRFLDRDRVHHINHSGAHVSVVGPSIVPRSPQGQLPIAVLAHTAPAIRLAARAADVVFVTPAAPGGRPGTGAAELVAAIRRAERAERRPERGLAPLVIVADLALALDHPGERGAARLARLDARSPQAFRSDAQVFAGSAADTAELILAWQAAGAQGVRLRPLALPRDLDLIVADLLPALRARGLGAERPRGAVPLRERFGLPPAVNRYAPEPTLTEAAS